MRNEKFSNPMMNFSDKLSRQIVLSRKRKRERSPRNILPLASSVCSFQGNSFRAELSEKPARTKEHAGEKSRENGTRNSNSFETESHKFKYDRNDSLRLLLFFASPPLLFAADLSRRDWRLFWNQRSRKKTVRQKESLKRKREREREQT